MKITKQDIEEINKACPHDQGVFSEPYGISISIKEPVIYMRWEVGGIGGRGYGGEKGYVKSGEPKPRFKALNLVLRKMKPDITFLQFGDVEDLIKAVNYSDGGNYYGNSSDYAIEYIILSELEYLLKKI